jgi:hypothetical protein
METPELELDPLNRRSEWAQRQTESVYRGHYAASCDQLVRRPLFALIGLPGQLTWAVRSDAKSITNTD